MYSGWLLTNSSGNILGAHQKIDRVSRKHLTYLLTNDSFFPDIKQIVHFEGKNGPDGVKKKSPGVDEPKHYYDPFDPDDSEILETIQFHFNQLVYQLKEQNQEKAGFEAAWLAHALVDGLTPAHHYPYEAELEALRGNSLENRNSFKEKVYIKGDGKLDTISRNWAFWGTKGLFTNHFMFEFGFSAVVVPQKLAFAKPSEDDILEAKKRGVIGYFTKKAREVALLNLYEIYLKKGWTPSLAIKVRNELSPIVIKVVTLSWYLASRESSRSK